MIIWGAYFSIKDHIYRDKVLDTNKWEYMWDSMLLRLDAITVAAVCHFVRHTGLEGENKNWQLCTKSKHTLLMHAPIWPLHCMYTKGCVCVCVCVCCECECLCVYGVCLNVSVCEYEYVFGVVWMWVWELTVYPATLVWARERLPHTQLRQWWLICQMSGCRTSSCGKCIECHVVSLD